MEEQGKCVHLKVYGFGRWGRVERYVDSVVCELGSIWVRNVCKARCVKGDISLGDV